MISKHPVETTQAVENEWVPFPGGELEGRRPRVLCPSCRDRIGRSAGSDAQGEAQSGRSRLICFECYRADLAQNRIVPAAAARTAEPARPSAPAGAVREDEIRWQWLLPFEPVNRARLERIRAERGAARASLAAGAGRFDERRRRAQIAARHALARIAAGVNAREVSSADRDRTLGALAHAAELQLPEAWLPFVMSR